jgi:hypothetical protein
MLVSRCRLRLSRLVHSLLSLHALLKHLTVVLHALGLLLLWRRRRPEVRIGVAAAEYVGRHCECIFVDDMRG